jgi:hypothetical protein
MGYIVSAAASALRYGVAAIFPMKLFKRSGFRVALVLLLLLSTCTQSTLSYSAICARCLQHQRGVEHSILGIRYSHREVLTQSTGGLMSPAIFSGPIAKIDPHIYDEIFGHPCEHCFVRAGFCRSSFGVTECGSFGGEGQYRLRDAVTENLYRTYQRLPNRELARATFALLDEVYPLTAGKEDAYSRYLHEMPDDPANILVSGLTLITNEDQWREVLRAARERNVHLPLLSDPALVAAGLQIPDRAVRLQVIDQLAALDQPAAWDAIVSVLHDEEIGVHAQQRVFWRHKFALFDAALDAEFRKVDMGRDGDWLLPFSGTASDLKDLKDEEIRALLAQGKPRVDVLCFNIICQGNRVQFLDELLALLNRDQRAVNVAASKGLVRDTFDRVITPGQPAAAAEAIKSLLKAPDPLRLTVENHQRKPDPWKEMRSGGGDRSWDKSAPHRRMQALEKEAVALGTQPGPAHWPRLRELYRGWLAEGGNEWYAAAFGQAMAESDPTRTADFLAGELTRSDADQESMGDALASMGVIANPANVAALEGFAETPAGRSMLGNDHYRQLYQYALHRCRLMHRWRLTRNPDSTWVIVKPE